jgi:hypothetical protein
MAIPSTQSNSGNATYTFPKGEERLAMEIAEFFDVGHSAIFKVVDQLSNSSIEVTLQDDSVWVVERDLNFFAPPRVTRNGKRFPDYEWSPSYTSLNWLLTLAFTDHPVGAHTVPAVAELAASAGKIEPKQPPAPIAQT